MFTIDFIFLVSSKLNPDTNPVPFVFIIYYYYYYYYKLALFELNLLETLANSFFRILISDSYSVAYI